MKTIKAKEGKVFRRIVDKALFGNEIHLGYLYSLHGVVLKVPVMELPEHFEEIDNPELNEPILDEDEAKKVLENLRFQADSDLLEFADTTDQKVLNLKMDCKLKI